MELSIHMEAKDKQESEKKVQPKNQQSCIYDKYNRYTVPFLWAIPKAQFQN